MAVLFVLGIFWMFVVAPLYFVYSMGYTKEDFRNDFFGGCRYSEKVIPVPSELLNAKFVVTKEAYAAVGVLKVHLCLPEKSKVSAELIDDPRYNDGRQLLNIMRGKEFHVVKILAVSRTGTAIDVGNTPITYLVLSDEQDNLYDVATVMLGINQGEQFLTLASPGHSLLLDSGSFSMSSSSILLNLHTSLSDELASSSLR